MPQLREAPLACWHPSPVALQAHDQLLGSLSALQLESVVYACQRHQQTLPDGSRAGFFIGGPPVGPCMGGSLARTCMGGVPPVLPRQPGLCAAPAGDGAGVGKGRTIAGTRLRKPGCLA